VPSEANYFTCAFKRDRIEKWVYGKISGFWVQRQVYQWGAGGCTPPPPPPLVFHIWVVITTYYVETIDFQIHKKVFQPPSQGLSKKTLGTRIENIQAPVCWVTYKCFSWFLSIIQVLCGQIYGIDAVLRMQEMAFQGFKFHKFSGGQCHRTLIVMHPLCLKATWK
jgi:hypothetical protein